MSIITRKLTLVGAFRGKDVTFKAGGKEYEFKEGSMEVTGPSADVDNLSKFLNRSYQAFPDPSKELDAAVAAIHGDGDAAETDKDEPGAGDGDKGGAQDAEGGAGDTAPEPAGEADGGSTDAEPEPGEAEPGRPAEGDGQSPIAKALSELDPADDEHWTADGKPKMSALEAILGRADVTRAQVDAAAPGFNRDAARG